MKKTLTAGLPGLCSSAACLALMAGTILNPNAYAQVRLLSWNSGDATVREWSGATGAYMSNVLTLVKGSGEPFTDQSDIEFDGVFFYSIAENDPRVRQYDITGRYLRDFAWLADGAGRPMASQVGFATDGRYFYTIARNDSKVRKYDLAGHYLGDVCQLEDSLQIGLATDGEFLYAIMPNDYRISKYSMTGVFLGNVPSFNRAGTPDGSNIGIAVFPPVSRYTNSPENLIVNGSFEMPALLAGRLLVPASFLAPWKTTEDFIEVWSNEQGGPAADGFQNVQILAQSASTAIWQTVPTIANADYTLTFYHTPQPGIISSLKVSADGQILGTFSEDGTALTEFKWTKSRLNFTASKIGRAHV